MDVSDFGRSVLVRRSEKINLAILGNAERRLRCRSEKKEPLRDQVAKAEKTADVKGKSNEISSLEVKRESLDFSLLLRWQLFRLQGSLLSPDATFERSTF